MTDQAGLRTTLLEAAKLLERAGVDSPRLSAELLLALALEGERSDLLRRLIMEPNMALKADVRERFAGYVQRRALGEPAAYILGVKEFYGRDLSVQPAVLIPRPETELLIDTALAQTLPPALRFADFGTGSGCIAVTLALEIPGSMGFALDRSAAALAVARANAHRLGVTSVTFARADFRHVPLPDASLDLIAANPPYISEAEYRDLSREVRNFEPRAALVPDIENVNEAVHGREGAPLRGLKDSSADSSTFDLNTGLSGNSAHGLAHGLEDAEHILTEAARLLVPGGLLLMEMGCGQGQALLHLAAVDSWSRAQVIRDAAGLDRLLLAQKAHP